MSLNVANPASVKEMEKKEKNRIHDEKEDLRFLLNTDEGRRFIWSVLEFCNVFSARFQPSENLLFSEGQRNVGAMVLAKVMEAHPEAFIRMMKDNNTRAEKL